MFVALTLKVATAAEEQAREAKKLSYSRTNLRRQIEALACRAGELSRDLHPSWDNVISRFRETAGRRASTPDELRSIVASLIALRDEAIALLETALESRKTDPAQTIFRPLQPTEYISDSVVCNDDLSCAVTQHKIEESPCDGLATDQGSDLAPRAQGSPFRLKWERPKKSAFSIERVRDAMCNLAQMVPNAFESWAALVAAGPTICQLCSINPKIYDLAVSKIGRERAAIALVITAERCANGSVDNPGAYLTAMVDRGRDGQLHLDRSLHAMAAVSERKSSRQ